MSKENNNTAILVTLVICHEVQNHFDGCLGVHGFIFLQLLFHVVLVIHTHMKIIRQPQFLEDQSDIQYSKKQTMSN